MLTDWLDGPIAQASNLVGIVPEGELVTKASQIYATEGMATLGEMVSKWFLQPAAHKIAGAGLGAVIGGSAVTIPNLNTRARTEMMEISSHMLFRIIDPAPGEMGEVQRNFQEIAQSIQNLDASGFMNATVRSPNDITRSIDMIKSMAGQSGGSAIQDLDDFEDFEEDYTEITVPQGTETGGQIAEVIQAGDGAEATRGTPD